MTFAAATATAASRERVEDATHQYQLAPGDYRAEAPTDIPGAPLYRRDLDGGVLARWSGPFDQTVTLVRVDGPAREARRRNSAFVARFERGLTRGLQRVDIDVRRVLRVGSVPALDLRFDYVDERGTRQHNASRTLFFKPYALTLSVSVPAGTSARRARRQIRQLLESFRPY